MVAFKSLAGEINRLKPMFEQDEINLKIIMIFLLLAKLMNKVLLTSPRLKFLFLQLDFPDHLKRLNKVLGILFLISLTGPSYRKNGSFSIFVNNQGQSVNGICKNRRCQNIYCIMNMLNQAIKCPAESKPIMHKSGLFSSSDKKNQENCGRMAGEKKVVRYIMRTIKLIGNRIRQWNQSCRGIQ